MPQHRSFEVPERDPEAVGPTFDLGGETFHCLPEMPGGAFMSVPNDLGGQAAIAGEFVIACLLPEDEERFRSVVSDKTRIVGLVALHGILRWLLNEAWLPEPPAPEPPAPTEG